MSLSIRLVPEEERALDWTLIGAAYMGIGTAFDNPIRILFLQNLTDALLHFSFDGLTDNVRLRPNAFMLLDVTTNRTEKSGAMFIGEGTRVYVKEIETPTQGSVSVSVWYGKNI